MSVSTHGKLQWFDTAGFRTEQDPYNAYFWHQSHSNRITRSLFGDDYTLVTGTEGGRVNVHALVNSRPCGCTKSVQISIPGFDGLPGVLFLPYPRSTVRIFIDLPHSKPPCKFSFSFLPQCSTLILTTYSASPKLTGTQLSSLSSARFMNPASSKYQAGASYTLKGVRRDVYLARNRLVMVIAMGSIRLVP